MKRRDLLKSMLAAALWQSAPRAAFATASVEARFVLVVLRGAVDGLALAAPWGDPNYRDLRGELALLPPGEADGLHRLDDLFGLHPSLPEVAALYDAGDGLLLHAIAGPYRERSHFDGQDMLENGGAHVGRLRDGWLNRALAPLGGSIGSETAIALAPNTPLVLRGPNSVTSWAPSRLPDADDDTLARLADLYSGDEFFSSRLAQAQRSQQLAGDIASERRRGNEARQFGELMTAAARFLTTDGGPNVAVTEFGGWDTHANQGAASGALANRFAALDTGLGNLRRELGDAWNNTVVCVVTEFGRTVRVNGTRGTDHGTATAALLLGGAVNGGRVVCDWPGLGPSNLYADRDLQPTLDLRSVFKSVLIEHLGITPAFVAQTVFPDSSAAGPLENLLKN